MQRIRASEPHHKEPVRVDNPAMRGSQRTRRSTSTLSHAVAFRSHCHGASTGRRPMQPATPLMADPILRRGKTPMSVSATRR